MNHDLYIITPGIEYDTARDGWCDAAASWIAENTPGKALCFEYECSWWNRWMRQKSRAKALAEKIDKVGPKFRLILAGHSNGCDVICRALAIAHRYVDEIHLIASAADANCRDNGIAAALEKNRLGKFVAYCSTADVALWGAKASRVLRPIGLGYGSMGRSGPDLDTLPTLGEGRVMVHWHPGFGHSSYFSTGNFFRLMRRVTNGGRD